MPIIKSAIKKMRKDAIRTKLNKSFKDKLKQAVKKAYKDKSEDSVKKAISIIDKAVGKNILKKNTASRWKSKAAKIIKK